MRADTDEYGTYFEWRWDDMSGQRFQRFSRSLPMEAWLIGRERPVVVEHAAGSQIMVGPDVWRKARVVMLPFLFPTNEIEQSREPIEALMDAAILPGKAGGKLNPGALERLWMLGGTPDVVGSNDSRVAMRTAAENLDGIRYEIGKRNVTVEEMETVLEQTARLLRNALGEVSDGAGS